MSFTIWAISRKYTAPFSILWLTSLASRLNYSGPSTGFKKLDKEIGGYLHEGLHVVQAAPGIGKTALGLQIAAVCGFPAVYVSAEMAPLELFRRIIARETRTPLASLNERLSPEQIRDLADKTSSSLSQLVIVDGTIHAAVKEAIEEAAEELLIEFERSALIVIDSLQMWARSTAFQAHFQNEYEVMNRGIRTVTELALELGSPILCITHRSRAGQERGGLHASKGTGDIEYGAETVLELQRENGDRPNSHGEVEVTAKVLKNRHGSPGAELSLRFNGSLQLFRET